MYNLNTLQKQIKHMGTDSFIEMISSPNFPAKAKEDLENIHIFKSGYPCLSAIYSLAK